MKRIQPYYFLIGLAALFMIAGLAFYSVRSLSLLKQGAPIEPPTNSETGDLFELWFTSADLFDLSIDRNVTGIIFGADSKKVSLLDRDRKLRWEKSFPANPLQTKISSCGNYLAVGTEGGDLFFMSTDQQFWWQQEFTDPVYLVALSANGKWVLIGRGDPGQKTHCLELYGQDGTMQWSMSTGPLRKIHVAGEQPNQGRILYSYQQDDSVVTGAVALTGESLWENEGVALAAVSRTESRLALIDDATLIVCSSQGDILWERTLPAGFKMTEAMFNPQNNNLLVYGSVDEMNENLYYFSAEGKVLWHKRIAEGALFSFTADGNRIITSSWRHYKEDFSQMVLLDESGEVLSSMELAMRVERLLVSANRRYIILGGEDGYIDVIDLDVELARDNAHPPVAAPFYIPLIDELDKDQMAITLYFSGNDLTIPVSRLISQTETPIRAAIEELIRGPSRDSGLNRTIPKEAGIDIFFERENGRLYLELSPEVIQMSGSAQTFGVLDSLRYTAGCFSQVKEIYLTLNQELLELFGDGLVLEQPLLPHRWREPIFIPVRIGERYYIVPREARDLDIEQRDLDGLLQAVTMQCRTFYFVPGDLTLIGAAEKDETVKINLNRSFRMLFPEDGGEEEQLQAAMILDALFLTAVENSDSHRIEIIVEGESWTPPQGYPSLSRVIYKPYHINPEF